MVSKHMEMDFDNVFLLGWACGLVLAMLFAKAFDVIRKRVKGRRGRDRGTKLTTINDLPKELLVSIFLAVGDQRWVRHTVPCVCKKWNALYGRGNGPKGGSKVARPLHETLAVNFQEEVDRAAAAAARGRRGPVKGRRPVVHASRVILWALMRASSVRKLRVEGGFPGALGDFTAKDLGRLVAAVGSSLTDFFIGPNLAELTKKPFWKFLRHAGFPAGRLRSFIVEGIESVVDESDVVFLGQVAGSLEGLALATTQHFENMGLPHFPESFCALKELRRLFLLGHKQITAIPAEISSLKKLGYLSLNNCDLSSLPKELGELSALTTLDLAGNRNLGTTLPADEALPAELGKMKSLQHLCLRSCGLRTVPAFVGELKSLRLLVLDCNDDLQIDAPLDFLIEGCPRLRWVAFNKGREWTPASLAHLEAFEARLRAKNPKAKVVYKP